jgi:glycosyltransferase involved in cell wall biosynthesis
MEKDGYGKKEPYDMNDVSVIIPAYNEEARIEHTIKAIHRIPGIHEVIVVNDGSVDGTSRIAHLYADVTIDIEKNVGKGNALLVGWRMAQGELIACVDADLEETASELEKLIVPIREKRADLAISTIKTGQKAGFGLVKRRAQAIVYKYTGMNVISPLSGQRVFHRKWLTLLLEQEYRGFGVEIKMTVDFILAGAKIIEVETCMAHREMGKSFAGFYHRFKQWVDIERHMKVVRK